MRSRPRPFPVPASSSATPSASPAAAGLACAVLLLGACRAPAGGEAERAAGGSRVTVDWIYGGASARHFAVPSLRWLDDGTALYFDRRLPAAERRIERYDPATGERTPHVDHARALASLQRAEEAEEPREVLEWPAAVDGEGRRGLYVLDGDLYLLDFASASFTRATRTDAEEECARFSPDGEQLAFVRDNDLWVRSLASGAERRLTSDGTETTLNGTLSWVYWEEVFGRNDIGYWWSGDSRSLAFLQTDESAVSEVVYPGFEPATPEVKRQRYPKAGEENPTVRVGVVDVASGAARWLPLEETPHEYVLRVDWTPGDDALAVQLMNRAQDRVDLYLFDAADLRPTHVLTETDEAWVNVHDDLVFLDDGRRFLWQSERDGYAHLYLFERDGTLVNQVTRGEWAVRSSSASVSWKRQTVAHVDEEAGQVYFTAHEASPLERHLYRVGLDGSGLERLSDEHGAHAVDFEPGGRYYLDRHSSHDVPPSLAVRTRDGELVATLAEPRTELVRELGIRTPELLRVPARDGLLLPVELLVPEDFDRDRRHPVIVYVYGGPSAPVVGDRWRGSSLYFDQLLLDAGYVVVRVDNRSAMAVGKALENTIHRRMMDDGELTDLLDAVAWLKARRWVDPDRVGIWGWSGGGTFTLVALLRSQEFRAGISVAPVTDWRFYDTKWTEGPMKRPQDNPDGYASTSLVDRAADLSGRLMLVHGTYDDNVHPQNAWALIDALIAAEKSFDLMIYPMRKHGIRDAPARSHLAREMLAFWRREL